MNLLRHHQLLMSGVPAPARYESTRLIARNATSTPRYAAYAVPDFTTHPVPLPSLPSASWYHADTINMETGRYTVTTDTGNCTIRNMSDDSIVQSFNPPMPTRTCMALSSTEVFIGAIGSPYAARYRISDGEALSIPPSIDANVFAAEYSPDGTKLAICGGGGGMRCRIIDVSTGQVIWADTQDFAGYYGVAWSPDSTKAAFVEYSYSRGCYIVNAVTGTTISNVQSGTQWYGVEWAADDSYIVLYGGTSVSVLDAKTFAAMPPLPEIGAGVVCGDMSADGRYLALNDGGPAQLRVYDLTTWQRVPVPGARPSGTSSVRSLIFDAVPA